MANVQEALAQLELGEYVVTLLPYLASVVLGFSFFAVAALIVWRKPGDRGVLTIALLLVVMGWATAGTHVIFESVYPQWQVPLRALGVTAFGCLTLVLYVFPDGRFVPRWTKWPALVNMLVSPLNALESPVNPLRWPVALSTVYRPARPGRAAGGPGVSLPGRVERAAATADQMGGVQRADLEPGIRAGHSSPGGWRRSCRLPACGDWCFI